MTRRGWFMAAGAFFLFVGALGGFFSYTGLEAANKWASIISTFLALASLTLSALLFRQSMASASTSASKTDTTPKYHTISHGTEKLSMGDYQTHNTTIYKDNKNDEPS